MRITLQATEPFFGTLEDVLSGLDPGQFREILAAADTLYDLVGHYDGHELDTDLIEKIMREAALRHIPGYQAYK